MTATGFENETSHLALKLESRWNEIIAAEFILLLFVFSLAFIGNIVILVTFYKCVRIRTIPNMYIISFAVTDLMMTLFVVPISMGIIVKGKWIFSESSCQFQGFISTVLVEVTLLTITLSAIDRCFASVRPVKYNKFMTRAVATGLILTSWFFSLIIPSSYLLNGHRFAFHPGYLFCRPDMKEIDYTYASILEIIFIILPLIAVVCSFLEVNRRMDMNLERRSSIRVITKESTNAWDKDDTISRLFGATTITVLCCWIPFLLVEIIESFEGLNIMPRSIYVVCSLLGLTVSAVKIFVYSSVSRELKGEFLKIIKCRRSRKILDINQTESNNKPSSLDGHKYIRPKTSPQPILDKQINTEEEETELQFENRTPTPNECGSPRWSKRPKSRIDSGHYSEGRTNPNTPSTPNERRGVHFLETQSIPNTPLLTESKPTTHYSRRQETGSEIELFPETRKSTAIFSGVSRSATPINSQQHRNKSRDNGPWQTGSRGILTPIENGRKNPGRQATKKVVLPPLSRADAEKQKLVSLDKGDYGGQSHA